MRHLRGDARLLPEASLPGGVGVELADDLKRNNTLQARILRFVHHAHAALAYFGKDAVRTDALRNLRYGARLRHRLHFSIHDSRLIPGDTFSTFAA